VTFLTSELEKTKLSSDEKLEEVNRQLQTRLEEQRAQCQAAFDQILQQAIGETQSKCDAIIAELEDKIKTEEEINQQERNELIQTIVDLEEKNGKLTSIVEESTGNLQEIRLREDQILNQVH